MDHLQLLQLDSVPVVARSQYLPLFSRLGPYRPELLDDMAWGPAAEWYETWSHEASVVLHELEPSLRWYRERARQGETWGHLAAMAEREPAYVAAVLAEVAERGPLVASQLTDPRPLDASSSGWGSRTLGAVALDWLFRVGEIGVLRTPNFEKRFHLLEHVVPPAVLGQPTLSEDDAHRDLLARAARAHGVATAGDLADYFRLKSRRCTPRIAELVEDGTLIEVAVEGCDGQYFMHHTATVPRSIDASALLTPFDPVVWRRPRIAALFDFEFKLEIYTPAAKRRWGYYVLPFLMGERLVARVDPKLDRAAGVLRVKAAHLEGGADAAAVAESLAAELVQLAQFLSADDVSVEPGGDFGAELAAAFVRR